MTHHTLTEGIAALASPANRADAAARLALELGAERLLLLVRDPAVGAMLPAKGFTPTLRGGPGWRTFAGRCSSPGVHRGEVDLPAGVRCAAAAICSHDIAFVLLGGDVDAAAVDEIKPFMPVLGELLHAEQEVAFARSEASTARALARNGAALTAALEEARAEHARLNAELQEQNRRKDDFLAMLGHELRNPLAPLVFSIELLRQRKPQDPREERQVEIMQRQVKQLSRLVDDLLDISRVSHGRIALHRRDVTLSEVVGDAVEATRPTLRTMGHDLHVCLPHEELHVNGDPVRLTQIVSNILHNAAKYTPPGGRVEVFVYHEDSNACVRVVDNGVGIDQEMLPRVFELFAQAPGSLDRSQGGLGIGLTLVKSLAELHGGRVLAESAGPGRGSAFTVKLPIVALKEPSVQTTPATMPTSLRPAISMLVVDDNRDAADSLAEIARSLGHRVNVAYGALEALQVGPDLQPDLVVLDIGMPEMDGYELARRLRRTMPRETIFVALSGYGSDRDRAHSREAGFEHHLVKPLDPSRLRDLIEAASQAASSRAEVTADSAPGGDGQTRASTAS